MAVPIFARPTLTNSLTDDAAGEPAQQKLHFENLATMFFAHAKELEGRPFARFRTRGSRTPTIKSWEQAALDVVRLGTYLRDKCGVKPQDRVAILSATRYEWVIADLAIICIGAISTPIYQTSTAPEAGFILWDSGATKIFVENQEQLNKIYALLAAPFQVPESDDHSMKSVELSLESIIAFEEVKGHKRFDNVVLFSNILTESRSTAQELNGVSSIRPEDLASIVYTSGTTGVFKGVMQTHHNHLAMLEGILRSGLLGESKDVFLYLPLAHSFARVIAYGAIAGKGNLILPSVIDPKRSVFDSKTLFDDIRVLEPAIFPSVPRIFEKIMSNLTGSSGHSLRSKLIARAINLWARERSGEKSVTKLGRFRTRLAKMIVEITRRKIFGRGLRYAVSGGAPISVEVINFFDLLDVTIFQGYGLTETTPALTANTLRYNRVGSVGRPFHGVQLSIASDGEVLCRGSNIAKGYWRRPRATAEAWGEDGWFKTGDIGRIDEDGYLSITDRKKELIVSAGGKKVAPAFIEGRAKSSPFISHMYVFGDKKPYLVALVTIDSNVMTRWLSAAGVPNVNPDKVFDHPRVHELLDGEIAQVNQDLSSYEQIKKFQILKEDFTIENGTLTPTLKLRRKVIAERYQNEIERLYNG